VVESGSGNDPTVRSLSDLRRRYNPDIIFLSETHLDDYPAECLRRRLQMDSKIVNPSSSRSGGLGRIASEAVDCF
jgi:hypothetical protein